MEHLKSALEYVRALYHSNELSDAAFFDAAYILHFAIGDE